METEIERRAIALTRLPVDLLVQLSHEGDDDIYEADAIDLGPGGIGLRAAVLPEVGQRLRCRFEVPGTMEPCEAQGEVVWSEDAGRWSGAFGVRFDGLDTRTQQALDAIAPAPFEDPETPPELRAPRLVKVRLDGVGSAIEGELVSSGDRIVIEQAMPFLQIGRGAQIEAGGERVHGTLERVRLRVENGMPRLVLELAPAAQAVAPARAAQRAVREERSSDATIQDEALESLIAGSPELHDGPSELDDAALGDDVASGDDEVASGDDEELEARAAIAPAHVVVRREREAPRVVTREESVREAPAEESPIAIKARELGAKIKPAAMQAWAAVRAFALMIAMKAGPLALRARDGVVAAWRSLLARASQRSPKLQSMLRQAPKRRTTAAPPAAAAAPTIRRARTVQAEEVAPPRPNTRARTLALGGIAAVAVGLAVYGLASRPEEPAAIEIHRDVAPGSWAETAASVTAGVPSSPTLGGPVTVPETIEPLAPPGTMGSAPMGAQPVALPEEPRAMPLPATQVGHMPAPSYPSLAERRTEETVAAGPIEPAIAPVLAMEFGASEVERGRTSTLRMSAPIEGIEGVADASGFTVTIRGALSLDRAGPIAQSNSAIERASILNRGDHSVLTIRFVAGRDPGYRIVARGTSLDVTIGR